MCSFDANPRSAADQHPIAQLLVSALSAAAGPAMADYVARIARQTLGEKNFIPTARPSMGGDELAEAISDPH